MCRRRQRCGSRPVARRLRLVWWMMDRVGVAVGHRWRGPAARRRLGCWMGVVALLLLLCELLVLEWEVLRMPVHELRMRNVAW